MKNKLLPGETVMEDDYNIFPLYTYIADMKIVKAIVGNKVSVKEFKEILGAKEIRRCEVVKRSCMGNQIGDILEP